jgi:hypothetical protein
VASASHRDRRRLAGERPLARGRDQGPALSCSVRPILSLVMPVALVGGRRRIGRSHPVGTRAA